MFYQETGNFNLQQKQQDKQGLTNKYVLNNWKDCKKRTDFKLSAMGYSTVKNIITRIIFELCRGRVDSLQLHSCVLAPLCWQDVKNQVGT